MNATIVYENVYTYTFTLIEECIRNLIKIIPDQAVQGGDKEP